jgi:hypothetical protein
MRGTGKPLTEDESRPIDGQHLPVSDLPVEMAEK